MSEMVSPISACMKLKENLRRLIDGRGVSLTKLSKASKVPVTTISNWLSGQSPKNIEQVKNIAGYFELTVDELVFGVGQKAKQKSVIEEFAENEIYAGKYEVILRKIIK